MAIRKGKYTKQSDNTSTTNTSTNNTSTTTTSTNTTTVTPKTTTTSISDLVPDTKDAIDQLTKNEEEGKNIESPSLEDIQDKTNEMDTNTNEYHPRPFTSTADSIISEIDFEEGVEGSDKKANKKAVKAASKKIKKAVLVVKPLMINMQKQKRLMKKRKQLEKLQLLRKKKKTIKRKKKQQKQLMILKMRKVLGTD